MKTQTIKVEGLPEGWELATEKIKFPFSENDLKHENAAFTVTVFCKKIQPREMRFIEILDHSTIERNDLFINGVWCREVKETDIPLTNEEPKLSLSVAECKEAMRKLETFNVSDLSVKICRFLKENS